MKHKLHTFFVIICLVVVLYCGGIEGKQNNNIKKDMWISRFFTHKNGKYARNEKTVENAEGGNKNNEILDDLYNEDIDEVVKNILKSENVDIQTLKIIKELDKKKNEVIIANKQKNLYKSGAFGMSVIFLSFALRELAELLVNYYLDKHHNTKNALNRLITNKWK
ncbi:conserved Plasmodium protein, unknown function [Plasmodium berghei]|uniref:CRA domain-containing protein, putative n=2 Tax=Plasmodium berghei TaxID=5821 RepID=A0A509AME9_PLABA|nr:CRA domain-containing protein, putative [Plasmodium berghei ANKA]CXI22463.1 conserved Plasmodium protein, unknown function [Plasmodium berghei]SCM20102.1 conserved Plasmodium protein, unknown function [Plasmodium berghei]SCN23749.1 conserved Plasmodium protein, unknown function [Plasmodium berghei]SCO60107.1 conserved Plasmodium protein, unknown function [Plasmodium berghei]VUC54938.1 CRA domain-containing protein, putative [Plasmodium berghei ANKA]|eukprot:XP_034420757.1 CRA domain-containing protein, putative [Plasmodium berghei ANKA]